MRINKWSCIVLHVGLLAMVSPRVFAADTWVPLGALRGVDNNVLAIWRLNSGQIVAGGQFTNAGSVRANFIAL